ncbi:hypothetical protein OEZ85_000271 [Tetradesmus obliquus]|uniref:Uncharacterized protein n=1 Tax=Tetradesmus obliquus TaxID=3088 RepID=A0ABY8UR10_TETOB|nr:hypothetical protein OEZ85_000271 [Tetradesmus obliquus]
MQQEALAPETALPCYTLDMRESQYSALYVALRNRAQQGPGASMDPSWFQQIKNDLQAISQRVANDASLSSAAKRRLKTWDSTVLAVAVGRVHAAVMQAAAASRASLQDD